MNDSLCCCLIYIIKLAIKVVPALGNTTEETFEDLFPQNLTPLNVTQMTEKCEDGNILHNPMFLILFQVKQNGVP